MKCCHWLSMLSCLILTTTEDNFRQLLLRCDAILFFVVNVVVLNFYDNEGQLWGSYLSTYFYNLPNIK